MKTITIEIPEGKEAKWVNNVLTLVDKEWKMTSTELEKREAALASAECRQRCRDCRREESMKAFR